ncbi:uncharacterized protein [Dermacentor andersoni]|uniref:uncharacterized protein isoform X2 n=1 Tax=Dermacentor andersoni TaxID=34620 RepID=UPI002155E86C|nr:uncharacterized protein LOC126542413 isoform X2 [Dermacentor andersoni]
MWTCETKVGITCLVVICGSANSVAFAAAILQWEEMVVSLSFGVIFFGVSIFFLMLLFSILVTDNQKGMTIMTHACKTRPILLLIFLGLFNAELRGLIQVKYERSAMATPVPLTIPPPGPVLRQSYNLITESYAVAQRHGKGAAGLNRTMLLRQASDEDENADEDVILYLSIGLFICNVIIDTFVIRRLGLYTSKMGSLPLQTSGSQPAQSSGSRGQQ